MKRYTPNEEETKQLAREIAALLEPQMTILLEGQLGAGKTTFTKGIAEKIGIERPIKSPTYTLIKEYLEGTIPLYHMDLYRMEEAEDEDLGLDEYFYGEGITIVEWGSFMKADLPDEYLLVTLKRGNHLNDREIELKAVGERYEKLLEELDYDKN